MRLAISPNDRLQQLFHPWTSYLIVPLFALANAGITVSGSFLARAYTSPVTLGILLGYVVGKPAGTVGAAWLLARVSRGAIRPPVGWAAVTGAGAVAGIGFIVSLLIASLAFHGSQLAEAKVGILSAALCASALGWVVFRLTAMLPKRLRVRALLGTADTIIDLAVPVDPERDHVRGPDRAPVTLVEYGDFECPYCGRAEPVVRELLADYGDLRYVWRHLPLTDVHPHAQLAAEGAEAAAGQGKFWQMHDQLLDHQGALTGKDLIRYAGELGLDIDRFTRDLRNHAGQAKIAADVDSADLSGVSGTPTFFVNGKRHHGAYDISTLSDAVRTARTRTLISSPRQPRPRVLISSGRRRRTAGPARAADAAAAARRPRRRRHPRSSGTGRRRSPGRCERPAAGWPDPHRVPRIRRPPVPGRRVPIQGSRSPPPPWMPLRAGRRSGRA